MLASDKEAPIHVLHVDDDDSFLLVSRQILADMGDFLVEFASSVDEALGKLGGQTFDIVVSDYDMPLKNGLDFLSSLRKQKNFVPFVLFTGKGREEIAINALNLGADGYYNKQGSPETVYGELAHAIFRLVKSAKAEHALRESEAKYRELINGMSDTVWVIDFEGNFIDVNNAAVKVLGYSEEELLSLGIRGIDTHLSKNQVQNLIDLLPSVEGQVFETIHTTKDGKEIPVEISSSIVTYKGKQAILSIARNITERKKAEDEARRLLETIQQEKDKLSSLVNSISDEVWFADTEKRFTLANPAALKEFGFESALGLDVEKFAQSLEVFRADGSRRPIEEAPPLRALRGEVVKNQDEIVRVPSSGELRYRQVSSSPVKDVAGNILGAVSVVRDITEFKKVEKQIVEGAEQFRQLFEHMPSGVAVYRAVNRGKDFVFKDLNKSAERIEHVSRKEVIGKRLTEVFPGVKDFGLFGVLQRVYRTGVPEFFPTNIYRDAKDSGTWRENWVYQLPNGDIVAIYEDVTKRKKAEDAVRESEQRWVTTLTSIGDGVIATDVLSNITFMNFVAESLTGWTLKEASKMPFREVFKIVNEQTRLNGENPVTKALNSGLIVGLSKHMALVKKDGSEIPIDDSAAPIRDLNGKITGVVLVFRDRTERRKVEEKLEKSYVHVDLINEKLRVISGLTRHDVRNKLMTVIGNAYLLKKKHADQVDVVEGLGRIEQSVREIGQLFDFAKMYEQLGVEKLSYVDVGQAVDEAVALFPALTFKVINDCHNLRVLADSFLEQLLYNLIDNTRKYGKKTSTVKIYCTKTGADSLHLIFEDDGVGISAKHKLKLFTEGFSTGGSLGYGLFLIKKMLDVYGWTIQETGELGKGVRFVINIPKTNKNTSKKLQNSSIKISKLRVHKEAQKIACV